MNKLGLVGGISWVSTIDYYTFINEIVNERLGGLNYAECIIYSLNFGDIHSVQWDNSFELLDEACQSLKKAGAKAIVLCANTAHMMAEKLERSVDLPIIDIVSATVRAVQRQNIVKVGLLGTAFTMEHDFYTRELRKNGIEPLIPEDKQTRNFIQNTLREELGKGIVKEETRQAYLSIANQLISNGAKGIILACTELPMIIHPGDLSVPVFNTVRIHSEAAVEFYIGA